VKRRYRAAGVLAAAAAVAAVAAGCGASAPGSTASATAPKAGSALVLDGQTVASAKLLAAARKEGTLTLYTAMSTKSVTSDTETFTKDTGVKVNFVYLAGNELNQRILTELQAHKLGADVIQQTSYTLVESDAQQGVFKPYCFSTLSDIPAQYRQSDCSFFADQLNISVPAYNTQLVKASQVPTTWQDILKSTWKGQIGLADTGESSLYGLPYFWRKSFGISYWNSLAGQDIHFYDTGQAAQDAVNSGQLKMLFVPVNVSLPAEQSGAPIQVVIPADGVLAFGFYSGLASEAKHPAAAELYLQWLASKAGQTEAAAIGNWPAMNGMAGPKFAGKQLPTLAQLKPVLAEKQADYGTLRATWLPQWQKLMKISS
jgi:iron(III) transport system substrate-binding protein